MIKNGFYFILKALFVLKTFKFLFFFGHDVTNKLVNKEFQYTYCPMSHEVKARQCNLVS